MPTATPIKLRNGNWGAKIQGAVTPGETVQITTKSGKSWNATVAKVVWAGKGICICATESKPRPAKRSCRRCGCTDPTCGGAPGGLCRGPAFDPCHDCI